MRPIKGPILNIGIILPVDKRKKVTISFSDAALYEIEREKLLISSCKTPDKVDILIDDGDMIIKKMVEAVDEHDIMIHDVPAGRGFHWEKTIDVALPGNLKITNHDGHLLVINQVPLEQYLSSVAVSEMNGVCPATFLEAQTITARSWILAAAEKKHAELRIDACNDDCCQRYHGLSQMTESSKSAAENSRGKVLIYDNEICDARYSKSCGGITENAENIWDMAPVHYLSSVYDGPTKNKDINWDNWFTRKPETYCSPTFLDEHELHKYLGNVDKDGHYFRWKVSYTQEEFCEFFSKKINEHVSQITKIDALNRGQSGRINRLYLDYQTADGSSKTLQLHNEFDIRKTLHPSFLYSSCFVINMDNSIIEFNGAGWGHGVGLCQIGALGMALNGSTTESILTHYFPKAKLTHIYSS